MSKWTVIFEREFDSEDEAHGFQKCHMPEAKVIETRRSLTDVIVDAATSPDTSVIKKITGFFKR